MGILGFDDGVGGGGVPLCDGAVVVSFSGSGEVGDCGEENHPNVHELRCLFLFS